MDAVVPLLVTKLEVPPPRTQLLSRERLLMLLPVEPGTRLVLASAPAGYGKTTFLSGWCHTLLANNQGAVAWLSLDERDNDPARFLAYLDTAISRAVQPLGDNPTDADVARGDNAEAALTRLINILAASGRRCVIVLDDYHLISAPPIHAAVSFLIDHLPSLACVAIGSRADPPLQLARLRARNQLVELRAADLRFTVDEIGDYFATVDGQPLSQDELRTISEYVEGWPAGVQLVALALRAHEQRIRQRSPEDASAPASVLERIESSQRFVFAYLADEVFEQLAPDVQRFLLHTAVLDHLSGPLCDVLLPAVSTEIGQPSTALLDALEQANMFILPLDGDRQWFRFHHLFQAFLRARLDRAAELDAAELHRRAAHWFLQHGLHAQAIEHTLAAGDMAEASALISQAAGEMIARGEYTTLHAWLDHVPHDQLEARPELCLWAAWSALLAGEVERIEPLLERADSVWTASGDQARLGEVAHIRAHLARLRHQGAEAIEAAERALALLPADAQMIRAGSMLALGSGQLLIGELDSARDTLHATRDLCREHNHLAMIVTLVWLGNLAACHGELDMASTYYKEAIEACGDHGLWERWQAVARLGDISRERNDLDLARDTLQRAMLAAERAGVALYVPFGYIALARAAWAQGDVPAAHHAFNRALTHARRFRSNQQIREVRAYQARLALASNNDRFVHEWQEDILPYIGELTGGQHMVEALTFVRVLLAQARHMPESESFVAAQTMLRQLLHLAEAQHRVDCLVEILVLTALAEAAAGTYAHAARTIERALVLSANQGYARVFLDEGQPMLALLTRYAAGKLQDDPARAFAEHLLEAFTCGASTPVRNAPVVRMAVGDDDAIYYEPLSERELEVLQLVANGASNQAIAEVLVVSIGTVKSHLNHILGKLAAHRRTEAVARARALGLIV